MSPPFELEWLTREPQYQPVLGLQMQATMLSFYMGARVWNSSSHAHTEARYPPSHHPNPSPAVCYVLT